jgi:hypothetical protein
MASIGLHQSREHGGCIIWVKANQGLTVLKELQRLGAYLGQREELDMVTNNWTKKVGWLTTAQSRPLAVDAIVDAVRDQGIDIACLHLLGEMQTFIRNKKGKAEAGGGCHDDDVLMAGIGIKQLSSATMLRSEVRARQLPNDGWKPLERWS